MARRREAPRREEILRATLDQIRTRGLRETRALDVARALGVSEGLVFYHFGSREKLVARAYELYARHAAQRLHDELDAPGLSALEQLRRVVRSYVSGSDPDEWALWLEAWVLALHDEQMASTLREQDGHWRGRIEKIIRMGADDGVFSTGDPTGSAWRLSSMMDGMGAQLVVRLASHDETTLRAWLEVAVTAELGLAEPFRLEH